MQFSVAEFLLHLGDAIGSGRFNYGPLRIPFVPGRNDLAPFDHAAMKLFGGLNPVDAYRAQDCSRNLSYDRASCGRRYNYGWNPRAVAMPDAGAVANAGRSTAIRWPGWRGPGLWRRYSGIFAAIDAGLAVDQFFSCQLAFTFVNSASIT